MKSKNEKRRHSNQGNTHKIEKRLLITTREYKVRETKFHVFSVQNSENELFLILFGKICDHSIQTAPPNVSQGSNFESEKEKEIQKCPKS